MEFKIVIGDKKSKKSYQKSVSDDAIKKLIGKKIGDTFKGELIDLPGYEFEITGGSDTSGFPMRKGIHTSGRKRILTARGIGFSDKKFKKKGEKKFRVKISGRRKKITVHGEIISEDIAQVNCKVAKEGAKKLDDLFAPPKAESGEVTSGTPKEE